jgi:hypothetical protein
VLVLSKARRALVLLLLRRSMLQVSITVEFWVAAAALSVVVQQLCTSLDGTKHATCTTAAAGGQHC